MLTYRTENNVKFTDVGTGLASSQGSIEGVVSYMYINVEQSYTFYGMDMMPQTRIFKEGVYPGGVNRITKGDGSMVDSGDVTVAVYA